MSGSVLDDYVLARRVLCALGLSAAAGLTAAALGSVSQVTPVSVIYLGAFAALYAAIFWAAWVGRVKLASAALVWSLGLYGFVAMVRVGQLEPLTIGVFVCGLVAAGMLAGASTFQGFAILTICGWIAIYLATRQPGLLPPAPPADQSILRTTLVGQIVIDTLGLAYYAQSLRRAASVLRQRERYLWAASEVGRAVTSPLNRDAILDNTARLISSHFECVYVAMHKISASSIQLQYQYGRRFSAAGQDLVSQSARKKKPVLRREVASAGDSPSILCEPIIRGEQVWGVLEVHSRDSQAFPPDAVEALGIIADQISLAVHNADLYNEQRDRAQYLMEADKLKSTFLANISHEFRTPLNSIVGFASVLRDGLLGPVNDEQQRELGTIGDAASQLLGLINDILDLSKIEAGKLSLVYDEREIDLYDLANSVFSTARGLVNGKRVSLLQNVPPGLPRVRGERKRIRQVMLNLISNAVKFTATGEVEMSARMVPGFVEISVRDTGCGMPPEQLPKLFQPFSQVEGALSRETIGTGLGLYITRGLVELHGGWIKVDSVEGEGSTFTFGLPAKMSVFAGLPLPSATPVENETEISSVPGTPNKVVLTVIADPQSCDHYSNYLAGTGYMAVNASANDSQAEPLASDAIAAVVDLASPPPNLTQIVENLRNPPGRQLELPVILCRLVGKRQCLARAISAKDCLVPTPYPMERISSLVKTHSAERSGGKVLVVSAQDSDREQIVIALAAVFRVVTATGVIEGLVTTQREQPVAVVLSLPAEETLFLLGQLRQLAVMENTPIFILAGGEIAAGPRGESLSSLNAGRELAELLDELAMSPANVI